MYVLGMFYAVQFRESQIDDLFYICCTRGRSGIRNHRFETHFCKYQVQKRLKRWTRQTHNARTCRCGIPNKSGFNGIKTCKGILIKYVCYMLPFKIYSNDKWIYVSTRNFIFYSPYIYQM